MMLLHSRSPLPLPNIMTRVTDLARYRRPTDLWTDLAADLDVRDLVLDTHGQDEVARLALALTHQVAPVLALLLQHLLRIFAQDVSVEPPAASTTMHTLPVEPPAASTTTHNLRVKAPTASTTTHNLRVKPPAASTTTHNLPP